MQMYLYVGKWKFKVMERKEVERQAVALRMTALDGHGKQHGHPNSPQNGNHQHDMNTVHDLENGALLSRTLLNICLTCAAHTRRAKALLDCFGMGLGQDRPSPCYVIITMIAA